MARLGFQVDVARSFLGRDQGPKAVFRVTYHNVTSIQNIDSMGFSEIRLEQSHSGGTYSFPADTVLSMTMTLEDRLHQAPVVIYDGPPVFVEE